MQQKKRVVNMNRWTLMNRYNDYYKKQQNFTNRSHSCRKVIKLSRLKWAIMTGITSAMIYKFFAVIILSKRVFVFGEICILYHITFLMHGDPNWCVTLIFIISPIPFYAIRHPLLTDITHWQQHSNEHDSTFRCVNMRQWRKSAENIKRICA